jgi:hypothetical protein
MKIEITNAFGTYTVEIKILDLENGYFKYTTISASHTDPTHRPITFGGLCKSEAEIIKVIKRNARRVLINPTFKVTK